MKAMLLQMATMRRRCSGGAPIRWGKKIAEGSAKPRGISQKRWRLATSFSSAPLPREAARAAPSAARVNNTFYGAGNGRTKTKSFELELVVPALCYSIRRGAVAAVLQFGGADFRRHAVLRLVSASLGHHRSDPTAIVYFATED